MKIDTAGFTRLFVVFFVLIVAALTFSSGCRLIGFDNDDDNNAAGGTIIAGRVVKPAAAATVRDDESALRHADLTGGTGVAGAEVWIEDLASDPRFRTITDASGTYLFTSVPAGDHRVIISYRDVGTGAAMKTRSAEINIDDTPELVKVPDLVGEAAINSVTGQLRDAEGNFLPSGTVLTLWGETFTVGQNGTFTSPPLPAGYEDAEIVVQLPGSGGKTSFVAPFTSDVVPAFVDLKVGSGVDGNHAPSVVLKAYSEGKMVVKVSPSSAVTLKASPDDADDGHRSNLELTWSATAGELADGVSALEKIWTAPDYFTVATITVEVKDPADATGQAMQSILVGIDNPAQVDTGRPTA
ncbi:MAG: carboxypeptidase regulatory-like domain-containing protein, partial [Candidatus Riflebacteria bacterium]